MIEKNRSLSAEELMDRALKEARRGDSSVKPNPRVGACLQTLDGSVVTGYHRFSGGPHAEIEAIEKAKKAGLSLVGARMAVTLEPCSHFGKTPPCTDRLILEKISEVFIGVLDPNSKVSGKGAQKLEESGILVSQGVLEKDSEDLNQAWLFSHRNQRPFIRIKMATSLDGRWTSENGESKWITGEKARATGHELRRISDVLITSRVTIEKDNPLLTSRNAQGSHFKEQPQILIVSSKKSDFLKYNVAKHPRGYLVCTIDNLSKMFTEFYTHDQHEILLEAGPQLTSYFLKSNWVNEIHLFLGAKFLGGKGLGLEALNSGHISGMPVHIKKISELEGDLYIILDVLKSNEH